jgi:hypothetical protein
MVTEREGEVKQKFDEEGFPEAQEKSEALPLIAASYV